MKLRLRLHKKTVVISHDEKEEGPATLLIVRDAAKQNFDV